MIFGRKQAVLLVCMRRFFKQIALFKSHCLKVLVQKNVLLNFAKFLEKTPTIDSHFN